LIEAFLHQVQRQPDRIALLYETPGQVLRSCTWRRLALAVANCAGELARRFESQPQLPRRIGHASDNGVADIVISLASMAVGAIEVPIDHRLAADEIAWRFARVGGWWIDEQQRRALQPGAVYRNEAVPLGAVDRDRPSLILWTSGTTGTPQGVTLSQRNLAGNAVAKLRAVPQQSDDVRLCVLPLSHAYARTCDFGTWLLSGCTLAVTLGLEGLLRVAPLIRPTLINTVPRLASGLLQHDLRAIGLDRLRLLGCGGAAISAASFEQWSERGVTVIQGYGLTEASPVICSATPADASPGVVGQLVDGWESELRDGQLYVRGPHVMLGYWDDARATADKIDADGWLATGDLVEKDVATGQYRILGRADEVIVLDSGNKVFPAAIQQEVEQIVGVQHAVLVLQDRLQLWFDADDHAQHDSIQLAIAQLLATHPLFRDCGVHPFSPQLCQAAGELTSKGTVRRARVLETRFSNQAGS
jgi:long-chain acyl-CoA synthetase